MSRTAGASAFLRQDSDRNRASTARQRVNKIVEKAARFPAKTDTATLSLAKVVLTSRSKPWRATRAEGSARKDPRVSSSRVTDIVRGRRPRFRRPCLRGGDNLSSLGGSGPVPNISGKHQSAYRPISGNTHIIPFFHYRLPLLAISQVCEDQCRSFFLPARMPQSQGIIRWCARFGYCR
jgi:hypothetical protein